MTEANLGETLRQLRGVARLSLRALAERTGFSASFLSQVENGQASPSIASMERIATALGVTMGQIFDRAAPATPWSVVRADARVTLKSEWSKARIEALGTTGPGGHLEPVLLTLAPGGTSGTRPYSSNQEEFALVLEGTVVLTLQEREPHGVAPEQQGQELRTGDTVIIRAGVARRWQNEGRTPARILMVSSR